MKYLAFFVVVFLASCGGASSKQSNDSEPDKELPLSLEDLQGVWVSDCIPSENATTKDLAVLLDDVPFLDAVWIVETISLDADSIAFKYSLHATNDCVDDLGYETGLDAVMFLMENDRVIQDSSQFTSSDNFDSVHIEFGQADDLEKTDLTLVDGKLHKVDRSDDGSTFVNFDYGYSKT